MAIDEHFKEFSDKGHEKCVFEDCEDCEFYQCELVAEYMNLKARFTKATATTKRSSGITVDAVCVFAENRDIAKSEPCVFYDLEKTDKDFLLYNRKLESGCIMSPRNVIQVECGKKKVVDGIGDHYKVGIGNDFKIETNITDRWEPLQPVFISAQTGQGKNYFIEHSLLPYVSDLNYRNRTNQRVLILSNRLALKQQIKNHLQGENELDGEDKEVYRYHKFADVMTYQSLLKKQAYLEKRQKQPQSRYIYVVCDEAHFFTSDAMFNPYTQKILSLIVRLFQDAIRVYMSATPYDCLEHIIEEEERYKDLYLNWNKPQHKCKYGTMVVYHFERNYSYLNINYYSAIEELYEKIVISVCKKREKWLIFIDDKEKCATVMKELEHFEHMQNSIESMAGKIYAVDASSKEDKLYRNMILNETLNKDIYVLISTSVLDNGVNLRGIDNIVISDMEKVKCLQMVGRARVSNCDDSKTLYLKRFNTDFVNKKLWNFEMQKDAYHSYEMACGEQGNGFWSKYFGAFFEKYYNGDDRDWRNAKRWFGSSLQGSFSLYLNEIAKKLLDELIPQYRSILTDMEDENRRIEDEKSCGEFGSRVGQKYLEHQLSWFGKQYCFEHDITFADKEEAKKDFMSFLESYKESNVQISKEAQKEFGAKFTRLYDIAFQREDKNIRRSYGLSKMNALLQKRGLRYKIDSQSSYWIIIEFDW